MMKFFLISNMLFFCGIIGLFFMSKHIMLWLLSIELMFLSIIYNFMFFSVFLDDLMGQYYVLCVITMAAADSAIGLAMLVIFYSLSGGISIDLINLLKG